MKQDKCPNIEILKEKYEKLKSKYNLPEFSELNQLFEIEEIDCSETEFLLRKIRRVIINRISDYIKLIESILNPVNAPMFFYKFIKNVNEESKKSISEIYEIFGDLEIEVIKLDLEYNEKDEADFIKKCLSIFNDNKSRLLSVIEKLTSNKEDKKNSSSYLG